VWLAAYPNDYTALANSALLLKQRGEFAEALRLQEAAVRVAPDQPIAWGNLGDTLMTEGEFAKAREAFLTALKLQNAVGPRASLYALGIITGDLALADEQAAALVGHRDEINFMSVRIQAAAFLGRMQESSTLATDWRARMEAASRRAQMGPTLMQVAINEALAGMADAARARVDDLEEAELVGANTFDDRLVVAAILRDAAMTRRFEPLALEQARKEAGNTQPADFERIIRALGLMGQGRPAEAAALFEPVTFEPSKGEIVAMWTVAQVQAKNWEPALKGLHLLAADTWQRGLGTVKAFAMVEIARAHAALGRRDEARKSYQAFFDFWKNADPDVPLLLQAREEFSKLGS
jgi:tetratricopeptide (TPR) repeat protein